jgi:trimeric autotransporter adhesin
MKKIQLHLAFVASLFLICTQAAQSQIVKGISGSNLATFEASAPSTIISSVPIQGLPAGMKIVGIDYRPNTGELFGLIYNDTTQAARLITINDETGLVSLIGASNITLDLSTGPIGFDFNPTVDRIRVEAANNKNYRLNPNNGAIAATDLDLKYATGDANDGKNPFVGSVAYTNSYIGTTSTQLFVIDDSLGIVAFQNPPNDGVLNTRCTLPFTVASSYQTDIDIYFNPSTSSNQGFIVYRANGASVDSFAIINSTDCSLSNKSALGAAISDIAVKIDRTLAPAVGTIAYALTSNNNIISFELENPRVIRTLVPVSGLVTGQTLVGMDTRPNTGELYGLGYKSSDSTANIYVINPGTGLATAVSATSVKLALGTGPVVFDFNPTVDRIRVQGTTDKNYRMHPVTGSVVANDGDIKYATGDANAGKNPYAGSGAYTNSFIGTTATQLFVIDDSLSVLALQNPPNDGVLNTIASLNLVLNKSDASSDLDIYFNPVTRTNDAYLVANISCSSTDTLYMISLSSGQTTSIGSIGYGIAVRDIAIAIDRTFLPTQGRKVFALTSNNNIVSFTSDRPEQILSIAPITGLVANQTLVGLDFRSTDGKLYGLGYNATDKTATLYTVDTLTSALTAINATPFAIDAGSAPFGFDFNPTVDKIRLISSNGNNFRLNTDGSLLNKDGNLVYAATDVNAGKKTTLGSVAYTNSFTGTTTTAMYAIDDSLNTLVNVNPPNAGTSNTVGNLGISINPADRSTDLEIYYNELGFINEAYLSANVGGSTNDNLYSVDLASGNTILLGSIGFGIAVRDIAIKNTTYVINSVKNNVNTSFQVYPNPNNGSFQMMIKDKNFGNANLAIFNTLGQMVHQQVVSNNATTFIETNTLPKGIYLVQLISEKGESAQEKIIVE